MKRQLSILTSEHLNDGQDDRKQVLRQKLEEEHDGDCEHDDEGDHANNPARLTELLPQSVGVVDVVARCLEDEEASVEREREGDECQENAEQDPALLVCPRNGDEASATHGIPSAEHCGYGAMLSFTINYIIDYY